MRHLTVLLVAVAMFVAGCSSVAADPMMSSGDVTMTWDGFPFPGPVKLTGPAVDGGIICASGRSFDVTFADISEEDDQGTTNRIEAKVVCDEGSGIFVIRDDSKSEEEPGEALLGVWTIESGTDDYAQLTGNGTSEWSSEIPKTYVGELSRG